MRSGLGSAAFGALVGAWLALAAAPARADENVQHPALTAKQEGVSKEAEKERTAADEVSDQEDEWEILPSIGVHLDFLLHWFYVPGAGWAPTKHMWLILLAAVLIAAIYIPLARRVADGRPVTGPAGNLFESFLTFVRDEVAKPNLAGHEHDHGEGHDGHGGHAGHAPAAAAEHPADRFVPFLWTVFLFILFGNLLGMFPFLGSPTANICVTGAMATLCCLVFFGVPIFQKGPLTFLKGMWPKIDISLPGAGFVGRAVFSVFGLVIRTMIFVIEIFGMLIKSFVLAVRLFANMFAGHMVLASILLFIFLTRNSGLWYLVTPVSVLGVIGLSLLELFVAFLQAYIFVFLTALFLGMMLNPEH